MDEYREFWNQLFFGSDQGFAGTYDVTEYWLRISLVAALGLIAGIASSRFSRLPIIVTVGGLLLWVVSVGPFVVWSAACPGCGSASSYDSARSYEAMLINQWWGGLIALAIASVWIGTLAAKRLR